ncbi:hypothetical protein ES708_23533 [subsurface metagenome]
MPPSDEKCYISVRDIQTEYLWDGFKITLISDIPSHLYMRWSIAKPRIHDKPVYRRGLFMHGDRYFCFTVYQDNEQEEAGDTLSHTFIKHDWPHCSTRYFYFWGEVSGVACQSTTAIFKLHFQKEKAPPPPEYMDIFNSIEPQLWTAGVSGMWRAQDLSLIVHPDATGVILHIINRDPGEANYTGFRKTGSNLIYLGDMKTNSQMWGICGLNEAKQLDLFATKTGWQDFWVMGYTGREVHFLDNPVDIRPTVAGVWQTKDLSAVCPNALAIIVQLGGATHWSKFYALRKNGSTDNRYYSQIKDCAIIGCDTEQKIQIKMQQVEIENCQAWVTGYIDAGIATHTNAPEIVGIPAGAWTDKTIASLLPNPKWAVIEVIMTGAPHWLGIKKHASYRLIYSLPAYHRFAIVHATEASMVDFYKGSGDVRFYLIAEIP